MFTVMFYSVYKTGYDNGLSTLTCRYENFKTLGNNWYIMVKLQFMIKVRTITHKVTKMFWYSTAVLSYSMDWCQVFKK